MLDPWIIEEIRRREEERHKEQEERRVEIPLESPQYQDNGVPPTPAEEPERGVVVIDM